MDRIISLLENLYGNPLTPGQIAELMDFDPRQSDYYYNAGRYLGLFEKENADGQRMRELHVCNEGQIARRASSVERWLEWIFNLTRL